MSRLSRQQNMLLICCLAGSATYVNLYAAVNMGSWFLTLIWGLTLAIGVFVLLARGYEQDPATGEVRRLFNWRTQSWTFMFGGPVAVLVLVDSALARVHRPESIPAFAHEGWWPWAVAFVAFVLFGSLFRWVDNKRYPKSMLKSPTKWWIDHIQMPALFGLLVTQTLPILFVRDGYMTLAVVGLGIIIGLMAGDTVRRLNPSDQHVEWDADNCRVATTTN